MRRALAFAWLAACSGGAGPTPQIPGPGPSGPAIPLAPAPEAPPTSAVVGFASRTRMIESRHGSEITALATTPDGTAVLSVDDLGGTRLWPALDGSIEPRVVDLPRGNALALGPDARGFVAGSIDDSGGMTIAVIDRDGLIQQRASLAAEPAFMQVVMTSRGMIATRSDHSIVRVGADGGISERLTVASGERIAGIASRGDKVVVQIEGDKRKLRWMLVAPSLQWGDWIPTKVEPEGVFAISPRGTSAALVVGLPAQRWLVVVDTATGAIRDGEAIGGTSPFDVAYADDDHIIIGGRGSTRVHLVEPKNAGKVVAPAAAPSTESEVHALGAGGERVIGSASAELAIVSKAGKEYLGYEIEAPTVAAPAPDGNLVIGVGSTFALLDKNLATVSTPDFKLPQLASVAELRHVEGNAWLVEWASLDDGRTTAAYIDLATGARQDVHTEREAVHAVGYDARSHLATFALGESNEVLRFDPKTKKFTHVSATKAGNTSWQTALTPLAPALADGNELLVVTIGDRLTLRWVRDARTLDKGKALQLDGTFAAADAIGNAYVWVRDTNAFSTLVLRDGKQVAKLRTQRAIAISPDPAGKRYVEISQNEIALVAHDGTRAWALAVPGVSEVHWLTDGSLALLGTGGLARVDIATGMVQAARCGWRFGRSKTQHRSSSHVEPLCTQLR